MARTTLAVAVVAALLLVASAQSPSPKLEDPKSRCVIYDEANQVTDNSTKTCLDCQMQCVGLSAGSCGSFSWNSTLLKNPEEAPIFQCSTIPVPDQVGLGTCAQFLTGQKYPNTFSLKYCDDCRALCVGEGSCEKIAWAGNVLLKGAELNGFACPPKPSPRPTSPAIAPSPSPAAPTPSPTPCINPYAYISGNPDLSTLKAAIDAAGLKSTVESSSLVATLFAPTNAAFTAAFTALGITPAQALDDTATLTSVLSFHLVPGIAATASQLTNGQTLTTANGPNATKISVSIVPPAGPTFTPTATGTPAGVVTADVRACASVIHVINQVLLPF
jgi:uncharacterized surface protein with fasciclin (FAS1) repeats